MTLTALDSVSPPAGNAPVIDTFQIADDVMFSKSVYSVYQMQSGTGQTSLTVTLNLPPGNKVFFWRVRAVVNEDIGVFSSPYSFSTNVPVTGNVLSATPPQLLSPAPNASVGRLVVLTALTTERSPVSAVLWFQIGTNPNFPAYPASGAPYYCDSSGTRIQLLGTTGDAVSCEIPLSTPGTYYWRASWAFWGPGATYGNPQLGPPSETRMLTVTPESLGAPATFTPGLSAFKIPHIWSYRM